MTELEQQQDDELAAKVAQLGATNDQRIMALAKQGMGIQHDGLTSVRLAVLLDTLLGPADGEGRTHDRLVYELTCQEHFATMIGQALAQVRQQSLLQGLNGHLPPRPGR